MKKILNNILYRFKEDSLYKHKELTNRKIEYKNIREIKTGIVFWTAGGDIEEWCKHLSKHFKEVKFDRLCFVPSGTEILETDHMVALRNEDLGFGGKIQNKRLHELLTKKYDLFIDLTTVSNALVQYVLGNTQAGCIVGMKKEGKMADIVVDGVFETIEFIDQLADLLAEIKTY